MVKKKNLHSMRVANFDSKGQEHGDVMVRCRILIVCEGKCTEPKYFEAFDKTRNGCFMCEVECEGDQNNTIQVVNKAIQLRDHAEQNHNPYDSVWAVFDKDDFPDVNFNNAIEKANDNGIRCAWSNEAFELWFVLHFAYRNTAMTREEYKRAINTFVNKEMGTGKSAKKYKYEKNAEDTFRIITTYGDEQLAIKNAKRLHKTYSDKRYARHNPCTTVYELVQLLRGKDKKFNKKIKLDVETN